MVNKRSYNIVAPRSLHTHILKNINPDIDFKLYSKEDVLEVFLGGFDSNDYLKATSVIDCSFELAKTYLDLVSRLKMNVSFPRTEFLNGVREKFTPETDIFKIKIFKSKETVIVGYPTDTRDLIQILDDFKISYTFHDIYENQLSKASYFEYENVEQEIGEVFNMMAKVIASGVDISKITLLCPSVYKGIVELYVTLFNIKLNDKSLSYFNTYKGKKFLNDIENSELESVEAPLELEPLLVEVKDLKGRNISMKTIVEYATYRLKSFSLSSSDSGIKLVTSVNALSPNDYVFILGLSRDLLTFSKDNDYLSDEEKVKDTYVLATYEKDYIKKYIFNEVLKKSKNVFMSYAKNSYKGEYESVIEEIDLVYDTYTNYVSSERYSRLYDELVLSLGTFDMKRYHLENEYYSYLNSTITNRLNTYDPHFYYRPKTDSPIYLSATRVSAFQKCPFSYYLSNVLKISSESDDFNLLVGNLGHKVYELGLGLDALELQEFIDSQTTDIKKKFYLNLLLKNSQANYERHQEFLKRFKSYSCEREKAYSFKVDESTTFAGRVDCVLYNENSFVIIDYKSSVKKFSERENTLGFDVQLLSYILLFTSEAKKSNPLGAFFVPIFSSELRYNGLFVESNLLKDIFEDDFKTFFVYSSSKDFSFDEIDAMKEELNEKLVLISGKIKAGEFDFTPLRVSNISSCTYCDFKDICNYRPQDIIEVDENVEVVE